MIERGTVVGRSRLRTLILRLTSQSLSRFVDGVDAQPSNPRKKRRLSRPHAILRLLFKEPKNWRSAHLWADMLFACRCRLSKTLQNRPFDRALPQVLDKTPPNALVEVAIGRKRAHQGKMTEERMRGDKKQWRGRLLAAAGLCAGALAIATAEAQSPGSPGLPAAAISRPISTPAMVVPNPSVASAASSPTARPPQPPPTPQELRERALRQQAQQEQRAADAR